MSSLTGCQPQRDEVATLGGQALTGSSHWNIHHSYGRSRLNTIAEYGKTGAWSAQQNVINQYIQADLGSSKELLKVATQGRQDADQWVTSYQLAYSEDAHNYKYILNDAGNEKLFYANDDRNAIVEHVFDEPIRARYVRLYVQAWYAHISLRWGLFSCDSSMFH